MCNPMLQNEMRSYHKAESRVSSRTCKVRGDRSGNLYLPVLATCLIASLLAGTTMMVVRARRSTLALHANEVQARHLSLSGQASVREGIVLVPNWRTLATNGKFSTTFAYQTGTCLIEVSDPSDGDLTDDDTDPYSVRSTGIVGTSRFQTEMVYQDRSSTVGALEHDLIVGGSVSLSNALLNGPASIRANGSVVASGSSVACDVSAAGTVTGTTFQGQVLQGVSSVSIPTAESVFASLATQATPIVSNVLGENICPNTGIESTQSPWDDYGWFTDVDRDDDQAYQGENSLFVDNRWFATDGPKLPASFLELKKTYQVSLYLRNSISIPRRYRIILAYRKGLTNVKLTGDWVECGNSWTPIVSDFMIDETSASNIELRVESDSSQLTLSFYIDEIEIREKLTQIVLQNGLISPTQNSFGATNPQGIYLIDCQGQKLIMERCRIRGTLLIKDPGPDSRIGPDPVSWRTVSNDMPALVVYRTSSTTGGSLTLSLNGNLLAESTATGSLNPTGEPHPDGTTDNDLIDVYECGVSGVILLDGGLSVSGVQRFTDPVIVSGSLSVTGMANFEPSRWLQLYGGWWLTPKRETILLGTGPWATGG